jgi:hypothetical protein
MTVYVSAKTLPPEFIEAANRVFANPGTYHKSDFGEQFEWTPVMSLLILLYAKGVVPPEALVMHYRPTDDSGQPITMRFQDGIPKGVNLENYVIVPEITTTEKIVLLGAGEKAPGGSGAIFLYYAVRVNLPEGVDTDDEIDAWIESESEKGQLELPHTADQFTEWFRDEMEMPDAE